MMFCLFHFKLYSKLSLKKFKKKTKKSSNSRRKRVLSEVEKDGEEANVNEDELEEMQEKILAAKFEQKMKKRSKGLTATTEEGLEDVEEEAEVGIGTEFTEQTSTTALDRARERFVEEQLERVRRGEEVQSSVNVELTASKSDGKFVSGGFVMPESGSTQWIANNRAVPEVELNEEDTQRQYEETLKALEEQRRRDAEGREVPQPKKIESFHALGFAKGNRKYADSDDASVKLFKKQFRHRI